MAFLPSKPVPRPLGGAMKRPLPQPRMPQNTGPLPPGMGQRPFAAMAEGGKAKKPAAKKAAVKKKPSKK